MLDNFLVVGASCIFHFGRLAKICQVIIIQMVTKFGNRIRELRLEKNLLLRQIAAKLDVDTSILSKVERGDRTLKKHQIHELCKILNANEEELTTLWLVDQVTEILRNEPLGKNALKLLKK